MMIDQQCKEAICKVVERRAADAIAAEVVRLASEGLDPWTVDIDTIIKRVTRDVFNEIDVLQQLSQVCENIT